MILFAARNVPDPNGTGSDQRAWYLLKALRGLGPVHLIILYRPDDLGIETSSLDAAATVADKVQKICIEQWASPHRRWPNLSHKIVTAAGLVTRYCTDAPRLGRETVRRLAARLPRNHYGVVVTEKLAAASILDDMFRAGLLSADVRIADFDDVASGYLASWLDAQRSSIGRLRVRHALDELSRVRAVEARVAETWDAVAVCKNEDVALVRRLYPSSNVVQLSNVIERRRLPSKAPAGRKLLFLGLLSYDPNSLGLMEFLHTAWSIVRSERPGTTLDVVGRHAPPQLRETLNSIPGVSLHEDVPSVESYYQQADLVVIPLRLGSGTRIKAIEAMAYGRPIVSTSLGIEGLGAIDGTHALIRDDMEAFARATIRLIDDPSFGATLAGAAQDLQHKRFGPASLDRALGLLIGSIRGGKAHAESFSAELQLDGSRVGVGVAPQFLDPLVHAQNSKNQAFGN